MVRQAWMYVKKHTVKRKTMKNTVAATKKRSNSGEGVAEPPAKRPSRDVAAARPSCYNLTPELIGHIARFLPMGSPDMMRLLLCVGPRVAAVVRKMYLTGNEYYLWYYMYIAGNESLERAKECIGYWLRYNEESWKKRCLGKACKKNVHTVLLTPEQIKSLEFAEEEDCSLISCSETAIRENSALDEASLEVVTKLVKNSGHLFLVSVGDKDVDDGLTTLDKIQSLVNSVSPKEDERIPVSFMRANDACFAYPPRVILMDIVDVLRYMIEEGIIEPSTKTTRSGVKEDGDRMDRTLLQTSFSYGSIGCFRYLLSLPSTDINGGSRYVRAQGNSYCCTMLHCCFINANEDCSKYLKALLAHRGVNLDARCTYGETALCRGCGAERDFGDQTIAKIRLLLEAGADPRIEDNNGNSPLWNLDYQILKASDDQNETLKAKLELLREDVLERIQKLNNADGVNM